MAGGKKKKGFNAARLPSWLPKNALIFSAVSFLNDVSSEMIFPILPIFLTAALGAPIWAIGLMEGVAHTLETLLRGASGFYSDRQKSRRPLVLAGYGISAVSKMAFAFASSWPLALLIRSADRTGKGIRVTARDAILAEDSRGPKMGEIFGIRKMADSMGAVIGPLITFLILAFAASGAEPQESAYRLIFLLSFLPAAAGILLLFGVKEKPRRMLRESISRQVRTMLLPKNGAWRNFLAISAVFSLGNLSYAFFVLAAADAGIEPAHVVLLYVVFNAVYALFAVPAGIFTDKFGGKKMLFATFASFALVCVIFGAAPAAASHFGMGAMALFFAFGFAVYGLFSAAYETVARVYIAEHFPNRHLGSALGAFNFAIGIMALPSGLLAGLLFPIKGPFGVSMAFVFGAACSVLAAAAIAVYYRHSWHIGEKHLF